MEVNISPLNFISNYEGITGDKRLDARAQKLWNNLSRQPGSTISKLSSNRAGQVDYYRLLENEQLSEQGLINELTSRVLPLVAGRDLLCVEESSEINVVANENRLRPDSGGLISNDNFQQTKRGNYYMDYGLAYQFYGLLFHLFHFPPFQI